MKADLINDILSSYVKSSYKKILIDGKWGIGKTKYVSDFMVNYPNSCYISLFGKKDISDVTQEIYFSLLNSETWLSKDGLKKGISKTRDLLKEVNIDFQVGSFTLPIIEDLHKKLEKELKDKETFLIFLDDVERIHDELDIKEVLGLSDRLANLSNVKTILVANLSELDETPKEILKHYREKSLDRMYVINEPSLDAPKNIMSEPIWKYLKDIILRTEIKNLRTYEKTALFIDEIKREIPRDLFTNEFPESDVYRMVFASMIFLFEEKEIMTIPTPANDTQSVIQRTRYEEGKVEGITAYLHDFILGSHLESELSRSIFPYIFNWCKVGLYDREKLLNTITSINNYTEKPSFFFSSEDEILTFIRSVKSIIRSPKKDMTLEFIFELVNQAYGWAYLLEVEMDLDNLYSNVEPLIEERINIDKSVHELSMYLIPSGHEALDNIKEKVKDRMKFLYYEKLLSEIDKCYKEKRFNEIKNILKLTDEIYIINESNIKDMIVKKLKDGVFFFPLPEGKITPDHWFWCEAVIRLIDEIDVNWNTAIIDEFNEKIKYEKGSKMLQHRMDTLLKSKNISG